LSKDHAEKWHLPDSYLFPALVRSRYCKSFSFNQADWNKLRNSGKPSFVFICHKARRTLPKEVKEFIKWGETTNLVRVRAGEEGRKAHESMASKAREKNKKNFCGWYDLGGILKAPIFTSRRAQYHHRFVMSNFPNLALDDGFIAFIPEDDLSEKQLAAELTFLTSDFGRFFVEIYGRSTGGGLIELDDKSAGKLPLLNFSKLTEEQAEMLSVLFSRLEAETRRIGGADTQENLSELQPILDEIDMRLAEILRLKKDLVERTKKIVEWLSDRRISRIEKAAPESIKGEEEPKITPLKNRKKRKEEELHKPLTRWMEFRNKG